MKHAACQQLQNLLGRRAGPHLVQGRLVEGSPRQSRQSPATHQEPQAGASSGLLGPQQLHDLQLGSVCQVRAAAGIHVQALDVQQAQLRHRLPGRQGAPQVLGLQQGMVAVLPVEYSGLHWTCCPYLLVAPVLQSLQDTRMVCTWWEGALSPAVVQAGQEGVKPAQPGFDACCSKLQKCVTCC